MSYNVAYKKQQAFCLEHKVSPKLNQHWFALMDKNGKVRDWIHAVDNYNAYVLFMGLRDYNGIPKGYTVERRGPVTRENW